MACITTAWSSGGHALNCIYCMSCLCKYISNHDIYLYLIFIPFNCSSLSASKTLKASLYLKSLLYLIKSRMTWDKTCRQRLRSNVCLPCCTVVEDVFRWEYTYTGINWLGFKWLFTNCCLSSANIKGKEKRIRCVGERRKCPRTIVQYCTHASYQLNNYSGASRSTISIMGNQRKPMKWFFCGYRG